MKAVLEPRYDIIVCGAGSSGSVIAGRLAENPDLEVLRWRPVEAMTSQAWPRRANGR